MAILNYTTKIAAEKTVGEILGVLARHGARGVNIEYGETGPARGLPVACAFQVLIEGNPVAFRLPVRWQGVRRALNRHAPPRFQNDEQALRVAWRIVKDWVEAQMALIEAQQAELAEIFLPYAVTPSGLTMFEQFKAQKALAAPKEE